MWMPNISDCGRDYVGPLCKVVMAWGVALWSLATFRSLWAAATSMWARLITHHEDVARHCRGSSQVTLPCMNNMIATYLIYPVESINIVIRMIYFVLNSTC
ncbi:hypothetical protein ACH5RR_010165 [Cinchona calisaya]|uniref:Uncharacterized protein n=1 Tax=Cinchona calisaya TaxID=153742 RepID=A0ABD3AHL6_9GENT